MNEPGVAAEWVAVFHNVQRCIDERVTLFAKFYFALGYALPAVV